MSPLATRRAVAGLNLLAVLSLVTLIALCLTWELWLAPLRPSGSWLVLKTLPLLAPLFGIIRGRRYTHQWASLLILLYVAEGSARVMSEHGVSALLAAAELVLATIFFTATVAYARLTRPALSSKPAA